MKTCETDESKRRNEEVQEYIIASSSLTQRDLVKSIGYDSNNIEYYLFFGQKYISIKGKEERKEVGQQMKAVLKFISKRKRMWSLIFFQAT